MAYTFPRWTEEEVRKELASLIYRAQDSARRRGEPYVLPLEAKAGETRTQAVRAEPDGSWELVPWDDG